MDDLAINVQGLHMLAIPSTSPLLNSAMVLSEIALQKHCENEHMTDERPDHEIDNLLVDLPFSGILPMGIGTVWV